MSNNLTIRAAYDLARGVGLSDDAAVNAVAVALAESNLFAGSVGDVALQTAVWGPSIGLWQIRSLKAQSGTGMARDATRLPDPGFNAKAMASISNKGNDWTPWSTWNNGSAKINVAVVRSEIGGTGTGASPKPSRGSDVGAGTNTADNSSTVIGRPGTLGSGSGSATTQQAGITDIPRVFGGAVSGLLGGTVDAIGGGLAEQVAASVTTALLSTVVWTAAFGLGATLIAIGAWRTVQAG